MTRDKRIRGEGTAFEVDPPEPAWLDPPRPCGHEWRNNDFICMDCVEARIAGLERDLALARALAPAVTEAGEQERCSDVRILPHWSQPPHECSAFNRLLEPLAHALASITSETRPGVVASKSLYEKIWTELWQAERELLALQSTAREWMNTWHGAFATNKERGDALVAILSRWFGKGEEVEGVYADYERDPATGEVFTVTKGHYAAPASPSPADEDGERALSFTPGVAAKLIHLRDTLAKMESSELVNEAWHTLYSIADPNIENFFPWAKLEELAATAATR